MRKLKILLVGCGKMGGAMLDGWLRSDICEHVYIISPHTFFEKDKVSFLDSVSDLNESVDAVVFAVKPQILDMVVSEYAGLDALFVSIAAGKSIASIDTAFGDGQNRKIVRVMPNTPAAIGQGISGLFANTQCDQDDKDIVEQLIAVCGDILWVDKEDDMHAVTAVSGSGPAYVFHMIEALTKAALEAGLPDRQAQLFARKTVEGAAALSAVRAEETAQSLREAVTSPNGTTQAGLDVLMSELTPLMTKTVDAAKKRSIELDQES